AAGLGLALRFGRQAAVVAERVDEEPDLAACLRTNRVAVLQRRQFRDAFALGLEVVGDTAECVAALTRRCRSPAGLRRTRRAYRSVDVGLSTTGDLPDRGAVTRRLDLDHPSVDGIDPLAID